MENFFILRESKKEIPNIFCRDQEAEIHANILKYKELEISLPYPTLYFKHLPFDFFVVSTNQIMYRINKYKKVLEEVGEIVDPILSIACRSDKIFIATCNEILIFNAYFDLEKSFSLDKIKQHVLQQYNQCLTESFSISCLDEFNKKYKLVAGSDYFSLVGERSMTILDLKLNVVGVYFEPVADAVFFDNYNKFICSCPNSNNLKLIEPNGLEHGDAIEYYAQRLTSMVVDGSFILLAFDDNTITGLSMKNFFWYKKFEISGRFYGIENNSVLTVSQGILTSSYIYKFMSTNFVINGPELYYTNLSKALIPPPFYFKKIQAAGQIIHFSFFNNSLIVADTNSISFYNVSDDDQITFIKSISYNDVQMSRPRFIEITQFKSYTQYRTESNIFTSDNSSKSSLVPMKCPWMISKTSEILHTYNFSETSYTLLQDGRCFFPNGQICLNLNPNKSFSIQFDPMRNEIFMLNDGKLQVASVVSKAAATSHTSENKPRITPNNILTEVVSFLVYKNFLIYTQGQKLKIIDKYNENTFESYVDENTAVLAVRGNSVVMFTRFGSLETETAKIFSRLIVEELISKKQYKEAASMCDHNHIDYSIFKKSTKSFDFVNEFSDSQALAFFNCLEIKNKHFFLEYEVVDRLAWNFKKEFVFDGKDYLCSYPQCIYAKSVEHIFSDEVMYKEIQNTNCCSSHFLDHKSCDSDLSHSDITNRVSLMKIVDKHTAESRKSANTNQSQIYEEFCFVNSFLSMLNLKDHFNTIVNVLIALDRVDLCFYLPNISKAVKVLLTRLSPESICKESIKTFNQEKIVSVHKQCQRDFASFIEFFNSSENRMHSVFHYLEDRQSALFYLISNLMESDHMCLSKSSVETILTYSSKHNVIDTLAMFSYYKIFSYSFFNDIVGFYDNPVSKFHLFRLDQNYNQAILTATENFLWRQALTMDNSTSNCIRFINLLYHNSMFEDAGDILNFYLKDYISAVYFYVKSESLSKIVAIYRLGEFSDDAIFDKKVIPLRSNQLNKHVLDEIAPLTSKYISMFNELVQSYTKYKDRLHKVRTRLNENINASQTSFSYSSIKSSQKALIKDRPGGIFENEFVLNKIRELVLQINEIRVKSGHLCSLLSYLDQSSMSADFESYFKTFSSNLREEIDIIWNFERVDLDLDFPKVEKPELDNTYF